MLQEERILASESLVDEQVEVNQEERMEVIDSGKRTEPISHSFGQTDCEF